MDSFFLAMIAVFLYATNIITWNRTKHNSKRQRLRAILWVFSLSKMDVNRWSSVICLVFSFAQRHHQWGFSLPNSYNLYRNFFWKFSFNDRRIFKLKVKANGVGCDLRKCFFWLQTDLLDKYITLDRAPP